MQIKVVLHDILKNKTKANLVSKTGSGHLNIFMSVGSSVRDILIKIGLEASLIGLVIVNKRQVSLSYELVDGDVIELFSPLSGG